MIISFFFADISILVVSCQHRRPTLVNLTSKVISKKAGEVPQKMDSLEKGPIAKAIPPNRGYSSARHFLATCAPWLWTTTPAVIGHYATN